MKAIDDFLNNTTMYRLILYYLLILLGAALILSSFHILSFSSLSLFLSAIFLIGVCYLTNKVFASVFKVHTNVESFLISALILSLIIQPASSLEGFAFLFWAGVLSMASKYILASNRKHFFNPVALAVFVTSAVNGQSADWWVGTKIMLPLVLLGGILIVRKIRRWRMVLTFLGASFLSISLFTFLKGADVISVFSKTIYDSPWLFFAFVMLTEPLTTPPKENLQVLYSGLIGFLFAPQVHIGSFYTTPELALLLGNIYSYFVSPKFKTLLTLREKSQLSSNTYEFVFNPNRKFKFTPGQYFEWTLKHPNPDDRGNRRYFTIASSPTENEIRVGIRFYSKPSSFKNYLLNMKPNDTLIASSPLGDFTLPGKDRKIVFIAGGIGITPFRSMVKYLIDIDEKRDATLFYANRTIDDISYKEVFDWASNQLGIKVVYTLTDQDNIPTNWQGEKGYIDEAMIKKELPDYKERTFYLSGPQSMVNSFKQTLTNIGVHQTQIKTDFFPGFN